jgi:hypothetical protein
MDSKNKIIFYLIYIIIFIIMIMLGWNIGKFINFEQGGAVTGGFLSLGLIFVIHKEYQ